MSGPVIVCLDQDRVAAAAARVAGSLARRLCAPLVLAAVTAAKAPGMGGELGSAPVARARSVLLSQGAAILADAAVGVGPDPELRVELGEPAERLASLAQRTGARLVVLAVPDRCSASGGGLLGNAYLALAGTSPCPVVVVPPSIEALPPAGAPILCGVDGSDESLAAARVAVDLGRRLDAPLQLVHVGERPGLSTQARAMRALLRAANVPQAGLDLRVGLGGATERLADIATREGAQLIVTGARGLGARRSALLGSVSSRLARTASQPLVLVRGGASAAVAANRRNRTGPADARLAPAESTPGRIWSLSPM
jgi:nucleotide-binding universal stress UspA family protein